jgi:hypothetical protein
MKVTGFCVLFSFTVCCRPCIYCILIDQAAEKELKNAANAGIPKDVIHALHQICNIAFCSPASSIDHIVNLFCDKCGCERELKPLLLFILDNHFGGKGGANAADACERRLSASRSERHFPADNRDNVIEIIMKMISAVFSRDDPVSK